MTSRPAEPHVLGHILQQLRRIPAPDRTITHLNADSIVDNNLHNYRG